MWSVPRIYKESIVRCEFGSRKPDISTWSCSKIDASQRGREAVITEFEGYTALEAVTRQRLVKTCRLIRL
jgi:hypothetical protein